MSALIPKTSPKLSASELHNLVKAHPVDRDQHPLLLVGIRGYYLNTMGEKGENDRGIYDDAIFVESPNGMFAFNGNTDPSKYRKGKGKGAGKGMACLTTGLWHSYQFGKHKGEYEALIQTGGPVTVRRDGDPAYNDTGFFGINIHRGGNNGTSSLGCQTIHPGQWPAFMKLVTTEAKRLFGIDYRKKVLPYLLIENTGNI